MKWRALVKKIKDHYPALMENGRKVDRPWGTYDSIDKEQNLQVKRIVVNPGEKLSLQMHYHRAETLDCGTWNWTSHLR